MGAFSSSFKNRSKFLSPDKAFQVSAIKNGDKIPLLVTKISNGKPIVSYKKAIAKQKVLDYIKKHGDDMIGKTIKAKITGKNSGGFVLIYDNLSLFLPRSLSALRGDKEHVGKDIEVEVINIKESTIVCSRIKHIKDQRKELKEFLDKVMEEDKVIEGVVKKVVNYGLFVDIGPIEGLVHHSEISYKGSVNPMKMFAEGDGVDVKVIEFNKKKNHISLSIKKAMPDPWECIEKELEVGYVVEVNVSNIEPYGVFVDLGNDLEGFLHISEVTWDKNIKHPKDYLAIGDTLTVEIREIDLEKRKLRVSAKKLQPKPFEEFVQQNRVGNVVKGTVVTITNFGAFIRIGKIDGLLLNANASWERGKSCSELLNEGDEIEVEISRIDIENEKVSLDRKSLLDTPISTYAKSHKVGDVVEGVVKDIKDFGLFVEIEKGVDALIKKEDLDDNEAEEIKVGSEIKAAIVFLDTKANKIRISSKRLAKIEERDALKEINDDSKITFEDLIKK
jgi:small subunit ribosomal protein S1